MQQRNRRWVKREWDVVRDSGKENRSQRQDGVTATMFIKLDCALESLWKELWKSQRPWYPLDPLNQNVWDGIQTSVSLKAPQVIPMYRQHWEWHGGAAGVPYCRDTEERRALRPWGYGEESNCIFGYSWGVAVFSLKHKNATLFGFRTSSVGQVYLQW